MSAISVRRLTLFAVMMTSVCLATSASAACCGGGTTAFYQPAAYTAYSPVAYETYSSGWYPGYFLDRVRTRLWGSPSTYVAAYPSTHVASYPSTYYASYPAYTAGYATSYAYRQASSCSTCSTYSASYAPACTTCASPCSTCVQQVTMRPICGCETCTTSCDSCSGCAACGSNGVSQASYQQSSGCATCGTNNQEHYHGGQNGTTIVVPNGTVVTPGANQGAPSNGAAQPTLEPGANVGPRSTFQRPADEVEQPIQPEPQTDTNTDELEKALQGESADGSTFFEAPKLFNPKDRTAQRHIAPVRTALYEQPAKYRPASAVRTKISAEQAAQDAIGWTSASN